MANTVERGLVTKSYLTDIGDAIRSKNKSTTQYKPSEMAQAIKDIEGDKYTIKTIEQQHIDSNDTSNVIVNLRCEIIGPPVIQNGDKIKLALTNYSTYKPSGYDKGIIFSSFDKNTNTYTITGNYAKPTSFIDSMKFTRIELGRYKDKWLVCKYGRNSLIPIETSGTEELSGKIFVTDKAIYETLVNYGIKISLDKVSVWMDMSNSLPIVNIYGKITQNDIYCFMPYSSSSLTPSYISIPNSKATKCYFCGFSENFKYIDVGSSQIISIDKTVDTLIIRKNDSEIKQSGLASITNLYVPSAFLDIYKASSAWAKYVTNFIALEGSKYEDPYAFLDEISN